MASCSSDFNPNTEWKEVMVVYGMLDQDEDTTWVRIQKCFLGEGSMLEFAKTPDSNYYDDGELEITLKEYFIKSINGVKWEKGGASGREFPCTRTVLSGKREGAFFTSGQPAYFFVTKDLLDENRIYELKIENLKTKHVVLAATVPIGNKIEIKSHTKTFYFEKSHGTDKYTEEKWTTNKMAATYQLSYRFYYKEKGSGEKKYLTFKSGIINGVTTEEELTAHFYRSSLISFMRTEFEKKKYPAKSLIFVDSITVSVSAANKELSDYMKFNDVKKQAFQEKPIYTNIENGIGIFASRRSNIEQTIPYDTRTTINLKDSLNYWLE